MQIYIANDNPRAAALAQELSLPLTSDWDGMGCLLRYEDNFLTIITADALKYSVDFLSGRLNYRQNRVTHEAVVKAMGQKKRVLDATMGWARDSFLLSQAGYDVCSLERSPVVVALVQDGLRRLQEQPFKILQQEAVEYISTLNQNDFDCIYLDPMFSDLKKSSLVKKDMQVLQLLAIHDEQQGTLLEAALNTNTKRIVVKRPAKGATLTSQKPNHSYTGKACRFDVYFS